MYHDFVAHCRWPFAPLAQRASAPWLWSGLRRLFPSALAAALMPNHLHAVAPTMDPEAELERLRHLLGAYARVFGVQWNVVPAPKPLPTKDKIARAVRYVGLNPCRPCRIGMEDVVLSRDPLEWEWSTHRDAIGAIVDPWVTAEAIAEATGLRTTDAATWLHGYVSGDPHVAVEGTPPPSVATEGSVEQVVLAVAAAHRTTPDALQRRGAARTTFLATAARLGFDPRVVAEAVGMHPVAAARRMRDDPRRVEPVLRCLGDERLALRTDYAPDGTSRAVGLEGAPPRSGRHSRAVGS